MTWSIDNNHCSRPKNSNLSFNLSCQHEKQPSSVQNTEYPFFGTDKLVVSQGTLKHNGNCQVGNQAGSSINRELSEVNHACSKGNSIRPCRTNTQYSPRSKTCGRWNYCELSGMSPSVMFSDASSLAYIYSHATGRVEDRKP